MDVLIPFDIPVEPIIDMESGFPINIPLGWVVPPGWLDANKSDYERIVAARKHFGVEVEDEHWPKEPKDGDRPKFKPRTKPAPLPKKRLKDRA
jgi:hypothetical protein